MSYFWAVIGRTGSRWRALDVDLDGAESLDEVADHLRASGNGGPVLALIEHEEEWFALIRTDGDDDPRAFVSDFEACQRGHYADVLATVADIDVEEYVELQKPSAATTSGDADDDDDDDEQDGHEVDEDPLMAEAEADLAAAAIEVEAPPPWLGDPGVLADWGVSAVELVELVLQSPNDPGSVVADLGERCGFDELIEALR